MGIDWYDMIARKHGGYKNDAVYTVEGISAEHIFEEQLISLLPKFNTVLDAGCGHGEFALRMSHHTSQITGFDNSPEMIHIANAMLKESKATNVHFVHATTKTDLPFVDEQFDLIYNRRGPTSILNHPRILRSGGTIIGIHSGAIELVKERLLLNGFINMKMQVYDTAMIHFPNDIEFAKFISGIPGNPDYTVPERRDELEAKIQENQINGKLAVREYRYIWSANKP